VIEMTAIKEQVFEEMQKDKAFYRYGQITFLDVIISLTEQLKAKEIFDDIELNVISKLKTIKGKERDWHYFDCKEYKEFKEATKKRLEIDG